MAIDGVSCRILGLELHEALEGARLDKIHQPERQLIVLQFRKDRENMRLALSVDPANPAVYPATETPPNPDSPPGFCMFLRRHLQGTTVTSVSTPGLERIIDFHFSFTTELGDPDERHLIIELMGRHSNMIVTNRSGVILESLIHVDHEMSRVREVMPARPYVLPPAQDKLGPNEALALIQEESQDTHWMERIPRVNSSGTVRQALLQALLGFSPTLCKQVVRAAGLSDDVSWQTVASSAVERAALKDVLTRLLSDIRDGRSEPTLLYADEASLLPMDAHAYSLHNLGFVRKTRSFLDALQQLHSKRAMEDRFKQRQRSLEQLVDQRLQRSLRRVENLRADLAETGDADQYQTYGELILASLYQIKGQRDEAIVTDYYDPEQKQIRIPLDPRYDAQTNAKQYFRRATRLRTAAQVLIPELEAEEANTAYLRDLLNHVLTAESVPELDDLQTEIADSPLFRQHKRRAHKSNNAKRTPIMPAGKPAKSPRSAKEAQYLAKQKELQKQRKQSRKKGSTRKGSSRTQALPPRRYRTSDGFIVLAGRSNVQNDQLTLRTANKTDLWFHVQNDAGTHVILRTEGREDIPDTSILEAAGIAAWFSRGNRSMQEALQVSVPVDYCPVAHVRKPRGANPGYVIYDKYSTVQVTAFDPASLSVSD